MTAQIANGGFELKPRILMQNQKNNLKDYIKFKNENPDEPLPIDLLVSNFRLKPLFRNHENINFVNLLLLLSIEIFYFLWSYISYSSYLSDWSIPRPNKHELMAITNIILFYLLIFLYYSVNV